MAALADDCGAVNLAKNNFTSLSDDLTVTVPTVDLTDSKFQAPASASNPLYANIAPLTIDQLTVKNVDGTGAFDVLMKSVNNHLKAEYDKNRITGDQYTKAYIELTSVAMSTALQFLMGKDQAYWGAILAQEQSKEAEQNAVAAAVRLESIKAEYAAMRFKAETSRAEYALGKMQLATANVDYCKSIAEKQVIEEQHEAARAQTLDTRSDGGTISGVIAKGKALQDEQIKLVKEQTEAQRAQTLDTRSDGTTVVAGSVGKQKALYDQQITSYKRDSEYKAAKMFLDGWITQKTLDEGLTAPTELTNATVDTVLNKVRTNNTLT